jgi:N-acetylmuramoyl-L-alanine amidase CwlA
MVNLDRLMINKSYPTHPSNFTPMDGRTISWIVIHYTGGTATALNNVRYYQNPDCGASAHFFVGHASESAQIYQGVDPKDKAWHCGTDGLYYSDCRNGTSLGVEVACHNDTADKTAESLGWYFDNATVDRLVELVKALMVDYGIDAEHVIRHYDVTHKLCPAMWVHDEAAWLAFKARLTADDKVRDLVTSVSLKLGLSAPEYRNGRLQTDTALAALFTRVSEVLDPPGDRLYRVQAGAFTIKSNADALKDKLVRLGFTDAFVTDKKTGVST